MAVIKIKSIKKNLQAVVNYAKNGDKTENGILVSGVNCIPDSAYEQMALTKKFYHKENNIQGFHIIQSFKVNEASPKKANQIGKELAEELCGDKYQILICTHVNKENVHNHIVLNSVSFIDGLKYHNSNSDFKFVLIAKGYEIYDTGKYFTVKSPYFSRKVRLDRTFGDNYSSGGIKERIYYKQNRKNDMIFEELNFLSRNKFEKITDVIEYKINIESELPMLKGQRECLWRKYNKTTNEKDKSTILKEITQLAEKIDITQAHKNACIRSINRYSQIKKDYEKEIEVKNKTTELIKEDKKKKMRCR